MSKALTSEWQKSSRCAADSPQCVEVRQAAGAIQLRDTSGATVTYSKAEFDAFTAGIAAGDFR